MNEPRVVESVTNECQSLGRAHESSSARAEQLIAFLEGEIAKRDEELAACRVAVENCELFRARIAELEARYQRDVYGLNNEGDPIGGDPAGGYANDNARLRSELAAIKAQEPAFMWHKGATEDESEVVDVDCACPCCVPLYAAPVSEAKAQGVVMPERWNVPRPMWKDARQPYGNPLNHADIEAAEKFNLALDEIARLNAAPVQQVSVPVHWTGCHDADIALNLLDRIDAPDDEDRISQLEQIVMRMGKQFVNSTMLAAAPAAPAADAGLVEALELAANRLDRLALEQGEFWRGYATAWADEARAAHRAKGVV